MSNSRQSAFLGKLWCRELTLLLSGALHREIHLKGKRPLEWGWQHPCEVWPGCEPLAAWQVCQLSTAARWRRYEVAGWDEGCFRLKRLICCVRQKSNRTPVSRGWRGAASCGRGGRRSLSLSGLHKHTFYLGAKTKSWNIKGDNRGIQSQQRPQSKYNRRSGPMKIDVTVAFSCPWTICE